MKIAAPRLPRRTVIKEEFVLICQDLNTGVVLDRILYRDIQNRRRVEDDTGDLSDEEKSKILEGWQTLKPEALADQLLLSVTGKTIKRALEKLVDLGFIEEEKREGFKGPSRYRPIIPAIQAALDSRGYVLENYPRLPTTKPATPPTPTPNLPTWDELKGETNTLTATQLDDVKKGQEWIRGVDFIRNFPPILQRVAYLVYRETGFEPSGSVADYRKQCQTLWSDANYSEAHLLVGLQTGDAARKEKGLTFSGPRSYSAYVKNARSLAQQQAKAKTIVVNGGKTVKNKPLKVN